MPNYQAIIEPKLNLSMNKAVVAFMAIVWISAIPIFAQTPQPLPFTQNWTNTGLITVNDDWSGVAGIVGYLGQDLTTTTGVDPQTVLGISATANDVDVIANQTNPSISNGGVAEFEVTNPTIALQGSGTADAPHIIIAVNATCNSNIMVSYTVTDIDATTDNAIQQVALQYRVGNSGPFTNIPAGYIADATTGPSLATLVTPVNVTLPAACNNQPIVQIRIITTNAAGNDEWVGIDNISVTGTPGMCPDLSAVVANNVSVVNSTCSSPVCNPLGGTITAPENNCPVGSELQYSTNGGATWSTTLPVYDQDGPAQSILTRCSCICDSNINSTPASPAVTVPGTCPSSCVCLPNTGTFPHQP